MRQETKWHLPNHILYTQYRGIFSIEDLRQTSQDFASIEGIMEMPCVHHILDFSEVEKISINLWEITKEKMIHNPQNQGWLVIISTNSLLHFIGVVLTKVMPLHFVIVTSMEAALSKIKEIEPVLPIN